MLAEVRNTDVTGQDRAATKPVLVRRRFGARRCYRPRFHDNFPPELREPIPIDETEYDLCVLVWQSTIMQALYDLAGDDGTAEGRINRASAASWFSGLRYSEGSSDFDMVCDLAMLPRSRVLKMAKKVMQDGEKALEGFNFRTIRKSHSDRMPTIRRASIRQTRRGK